MANEPSRLAREGRTIQAMLQIYCKAKHGSRGALCADCNALASYARERLERCPFRGEKPTCANCPVHCYKPAMRERIRQVMRFAGPRMLYRHPLLAVRHLADGRRKAPVFQRRKKPEI